MRSRNVYSFCVHLLLGAFVFNAFLAFIPYIDYALHYETVNKELCRERTQEINQCNGFCQLSKKMEESVLSFALEDQDGSFSDFDTSHLPPPSQKLEYQRLSDDFWEYEFWENKQLFAHSLKEFKSTITLDTPTPPPRVRFLS
jgi:hypothetical protein